MMLKLCLYFYIYLIFNKFAGCSVEEQKQQTCSGNNLDDQEEQTCSDATFEETKRSKGLKKYLDPLLDKKPWMDFRLSKHISPSRYDLLLHLDVFSDIFSGNVNITVNVLEETFYFVVHAKQLDITRSSIYNLGSKKYIPINKEFKQGEHDYFVLEMKEKALPGNYVLEFLFDGKYDTQNRIGIFKATYKNQEMQQKTAISTYFGVNYARRAFPCFDEPALKAVYKISILHNQGYKAMSNSKVEDTSSTEGNLLMTKFEETPPMSSYLVSAVLCDFKFKETVSKNGVKITAYAADVNVDKTEFALTWASKILLHFEKLFQIPYPLSKLDLIVSPYHYKSRTSGMANWGLMKFDDLYIFIDDSATLHDKIEVAKLVSHEIAYMWFGNLVTMEWWNEAWMIEAFATFFEWKSISLFEPQVPDADAIEVLEQYSIMETDEHVNARSLTRQVIDVEFDEVYDEIVYKKGASLFRMLFNFMGEKEFMQGISSFLKKYKYRTASLENLWKELVVSSKKESNEHNVMSYYEFNTKMMNLWSEQNNFPCVTIKRTDGSCYADKQRFSIGLDLNPPLDKSSKYTWDVPLTYIYYNEKRSGILDLDSAMRTVFSCGDSELLKYNVNSTGYYFVNYDCKDWKLIIEKLQKNHATFSATDRLNLLFDAFNLAAAGIIDYGIPLSMTEYLQAEKHSKVWYLAVKYLSKIKSYEFDQRNVTLLIQTYIRHLSEYHFIELGFHSQDNYHERDLRNQIIETACENVNSYCLKEASDAYISWMGDQKIDPEMLRSVLKYGLRYLKDEKYFDFLLDLYSKEENVLLKQKYLEALSSIRNTVLITRLLSYADGTPEKSDIVRNILINIAEDNDLLSLAMDYIFSNWESIVRMYGISMAEFIAENVFSHCQTEKVLKKVEEFYKKYPIDKSGQKPRMRTLQNIQLNIRWLEKYQDTVTKWFMEWNMDLECGTL